MPMQTESMYRYRLSCGHTYSCTAKSLCADCSEWDSEERAADDYYHWFVCPCKVGNVHVLTHAEAAEAQQVPRTTCSNGRNMVDTEIAEMVDRAIIRFRVICMLRIYAGSVPATRIAELCGVTRMTVWRIVKLDPTLMWSSDKSDESDESDI